MREKNGIKFEPPYVGCYRELGWHVFLVYFWRSALDFDGWCDTVWVSVVGKEDEQEGRK